jgi:hypothetical protein
MAENLDSELATNIKAAKTKRMHFAFVAKGGGDGALVLAKGKVPPALITVAKKKSGGTQVIQGACFGEDGKIVFEMAHEPPATMEAALKKVIQRDAGISQHCICRRGTNPDLVEGNVTEPPVAPGGIPKAPPPAPSPPPMKQPTAQPTAKQSSEKAEPPDAVWKRKDAALVPQLKTVLAKGGELATKVAADYKTARALTGEKKYAEAVTRLDAISAAILAATAAEKSAGKPTGSEPGKTAEKGRLSLVKLGKARLEWRTVLKQSRVGIKRVQGALRREFGADAEQQPKLANALKQLDSISADFNEELGARLDDVLNAKDDPQRQTATTIARTMMDKFTRKIDGNEVMAALDGNSLVPDTKIIKPMRDKLREISTALG